MCGFKGKAMGDWRLGDQWSLNQLFVCVPVYLGGCETMVGDGGGNYWGSRRVPVSSLCTCMCVCGWVPAARHQTVCASS